MSPEQLTNEKIRQYEQVLKDRHEQLAGDMQMLEGQAETGPEGAHADPSKVPTHPADAAPDLRNEQKDLQLTESLRDELRQIEEALERIESGTYGRCLECDKPIEPKRLDARPWSKLCLQHASNQHG
ncbi:MAG: TraR/DksA family transcriptional regulator [Phycisphaerae bacterium]